MNVLVRIFLLVFLIAREQCLSKERQELLTNGYIENRPTRVWTQERYPYEGLTTDIPYRREIDRFIYSGKLKAKATDSYPFFQNNSCFLQNVNNYLCKSAKTLLCKFMQEFSEEELETDLDDEAIHLDFDKREFDYFLTPTYASPNLISVFGELHTYAGMPHGSSRYYSFNFWYDGQQTVVLTLEDLFLPEQDFANFLTEYCLNTLKTEQVGYSYPDPSGNIPIEIGLKDLNIFILSKNGLTITFQPYHVGGWADGPYSITIPFHHLLHLKRLKGPLDELL